MNPWEYTFFLLAWELELLEGDEYEATPIFDSLVNARKL